MRLPRSALVTLALLAGVAAAVALAVRQMALGAALIAAGVAAVIASRRAPPSPARPASAGFFGRGGIARNAISSGVATGSDFALVALLVSGSSVAAPIATFVGCVLGGIINFSVNRVWAFGSDAPTGPQALRYLFVTSSSAVLNSGLVAVLLLLPSLPYAIAWWLVRVAVFGLWNYPLNRDWVFTPSELRRCSARPSSSLRPSS